MIVESADDSTNEPRAHNRTGGSARRQRVTVLAHPVSVALLAIWAVNDHVWKDEFGSWWTGKLSDLAGMVVFPLLIAVAINRWTRRPMELAIAFTASFFTAINVFAPADVATEWLLSLIVNSRLTMDPTDLVVLPALTGAWWLWNRPAQTLRRLRTAWGRVMFGVGVAITLATSQLPSFTENVSGTVTLTAEQPTVVIPIELTLDGDPASEKELNRLGTMVSFTSLASVDVVSASGTSSLVDIVVEPRTDRAPGSADVEVTLRDKQFAPVIADWDVEANTYSPTILIVAIGDGKQPVLTASPPPPNAEISALSSLDASGNPYSGDLEPRAWEWSITAEPGATLRVGVSSSLGAGAVQLTTETGPVDFEPGFAREMTLPTSCATATCSFSLWVTSLNEPGFLGEIELFGDASEISVDPPQERKLVSQRATFTYPPVTVRLGDEYVLPLELRIPEPENPIVAASTFAQVRPVAIESIEGVEVWSRIGTKRDLFHPTAMVGCCIDVPVTLTAENRGQSEVNVEEVSVRAEATVEVWRLQRVFKRNIELVPLDE